MVVNESLTNTKKIISGILLLLLSLGFSTLILLITDLNSLLQKIFLFITVGIFVLLLTGGEDYIQIILGYSIAGFDNQVTTA